MDAEVQTAREGQIGMVRVGRPGTLNALRSAALRQLVGALQRFEQDAQVRCILVTGSERAFAADLDVAELVEASMVEMQQRDLLGCWDEITRLRKPLAAAVSGYALGLGCELALACDIVVASETARFSLPQVGLGVIPGAGGTQRLIRAVGKACAMDMILTGRMITAREALAMGLVSRVVPRENCVDQALGICRELCHQPPLALRSAKAAVRQAEQVSLRDGLTLERQVYYMLFGTDDQKEGMRAYLEKRPPIFAGR